MSAKKNTAAEEHSNVSEILSQSEQFIEKNQKNLLIGIGAIILLVVAILAYRNYYLLPKEREAEAAIVRGEDYMTTEQWDKALKGDSVDFIGFESIIDDYKFTKTGKLAQAYAGICYYHKGEFETAKDYLSKYNADDRMVSPAITGLIGDCYVDMGDVDKGVSYFEKAAQKADNDLLSPIYLKKAGIAYESLNKYDKAIEVYTAIKEKYPTSQEANGIDKYIDRVKLKS